jgi:hypothetical protein
LKERWINFFPVVKNFAAELSYPLFPASAISLF